jgi:glycosyltransferase involved in cell wall biosynthesis
MTIRVLHVIPSFAGGGAERQLAELCAGLVAKGVEVHIAYQHAGPNLCYAESNGVRLHKINVKNSHNPLFIISLIRLIWKVSPNLIQTWLLQADVFGCIAARITRTPWILSERSSEGAYTEGYKFVLRRHLGLSANAIIANSEGGLDYWRREGYCGRMFVINNVVHPRKSIAILEENLLKVGHEIIAVGRFVGSKNWPILIKALEIVFRAIPKSYATFAGVGPLLLQIKADVISSPTLNGRVNFLGYTNDVEERIRGADVFVSLSEFEGSPNAVIEAISVGCPLVVSNIPSHHELLFDEEAVFVSQSNVNEIATAIIGVLRNPLITSRGLERAKKRIANWNLDVIVTKYISAYIRILAGAK